MAVPSYTEDLTDIATGDELAGWVELTGTDGNGDAYNAMGVPAYGDNEYPYIQGLYAVTQDCTKSTSVGSMAFSAGSITVPTDGAILVWQNFSSPFAFGSYAQGGYRICVGSGTADFKVWYVGGNDKGRMPYGGFENHAVNPTVTADTTAGTPTAVLNFIGSAVYVVSGPSKGEPHQADVMRYGRCSAIFEHGEVGNYANIAGFALQNDNQTNRWGLIQGSPGGYLWKGRFQLGTVTNPVDFRDSNKIVFIDWTPKVTINFNLIEVINDASNVELVGYSFICLDLTTASRGRFLMTDQADVLLSKCSFADMDTFVFSYDGTNVVNVLTCIFSRCNQITQGGATITGCTFDSNVSATSIVANNPSVVTDNKFVSDGSNHAMQATVAGDYNWNNILEGYATVDGSTGNEAFYNNSGGHINLTVTGGTVPYVRNEGISTTTVIVPEVTVTFNGLPEGCEATIKQGSFRLAHVQSVTGGTFVYNYSFSVLENAKYIFVMPGYEMEYGTFQLKPTNQEFTFTFKPDPSYIP